MKNTIICVQVGLDIHGYKKRRTIITITRAVDDCGGFDLLFIYLFLIYGFDLLFLP